MDYLSSEIEVPVFTNCFRKQIEKNAQLQEGIELIKKNSHGKIWLIGGFVYRNIASSIYALPRPEVDLDFIVEKPVSEFNLPNGWCVETNRHGNPKFVFGDKKIDYVPLESLFSIKYRQLEPTIQNYLIGTPFTLQSVAYDVNEQKIITSRQGLDAMLRRIVEVQDVYLAKYAAEKKNMTLNEMIKRKADSLLFTPIFLDN